MWRRGDLKQDRLVEEARAGKRASMQGLTTEKLEGSGERERRGLFFFGGGYRGSSGEESESSVW